MRLWSLTLALTLALTVAPGTAGHVSDNLWGLRFVGLTYHLPPPARPTLRVCCAQTEGRAGLWRLTTLHLRAWPLCPPSSSHLQDIWILLRVAGWPGREVLPDLLPEETRAGRLSLAAAAGSPGPGAPAHPPAGVRRGRSCPHVPFLRWRGRRRQGLAGGSGSAGLVWLPLPFSGEVRNLGFSVELGRF